MNLATFLVGAIVLVIFIVIVVGEVKRRKKGGGCGCGCQGCPSAGLCHGSEQDHDKR